MDPAAGLVTCVLLFDESEQLLDRGLAGAQQEVRLQRDQRRCRGHSGEMDRSGCIADEPGILARASMHVRWPIPPSEVLGGKRDVAQEVRIPGPDQIIICCGEGLELRLRVPGPSRSLEHGVGDRYVRMDS